MTLKDFMETVGYRISEGSDYCWTCYGNNAYSLDSNKDRLSGASVTFDTVTQVVYAMQVYDYVADRAYRWMNPDYVYAYNKEANDRGVPRDEAWDDVSYVDLTVECDFLEKMAAILAGEEYDDRVQLELKFTDAEMLLYMRAAHELDITFNQFVNQALAQAMVEAKNDRV